MANLVGSAYIQIHARGDALEREIKAIGKKAGEDAGKEFNEGFAGFGPELTKKMKEQGHDLGDSFADAASKSAIGKLQSKNRALAEAFFGKGDLKKLVQDLGGTTKGVVELRKQMRELVDTGILTEEQMVSLSVELRKQQGVWAKQETVIRRATFAAEENARAQAKAAEEQKAADDLAVASAKWAAQEKIKAKEAERDSLKRLAEVNKQAAADARAENDRLAKSLKDLNLVLGSKQNWDLLGGSIDNVDQRLVELNESGKITNDQFTVMHVRAFQLSRGLDKIGESSNAASKLMDKLSGSWRRMDSTVRLVLTLIAAGASDIAALGSAAGAGVVTLGAALTQLIPAAFGIGTMFSRLNKDLEELPEAMRPVAREFDSFKDTITETADVMAGAAFRRMPDTWSKLEDTLRGIQPTLSRVGDATGIVTDQFADTFKVGSHGFRALTAFIDNSADSFVLLGGAVTDWSVALLDGFNGAQPLVEDLYEWVGRLADQFGAFARSSEFDVWVRNAQRTFGGLSDVIDATFKAMSSISDADAFDRLLSLLDDVAAAMPGLFKGLDVISVLDPLGLLVKVLSELLVAAEPLFEALMPIADALNAVVATGVDALVPVLTAFANTLAFLINAVPAEVLLTLIGTILLMKNFSTIVDSLKIAGTAIGLFGLELKGLPAKIAGLSGALKGAGLIGLAFAGVAAFAEFAESLKATDSEFQNVIRSGGGVMAILRAEDKGRIISFFDDASGSAKAFKENLDLIAHNDFARGFSQPASQLKASLQEIGDQLATTAQVDLPAAADAFRGFTEEMGLNKAQQVDLLNSMGPYKQVLMDIASEQGIAATEANLLKLAMEGQTPAMEEAEEAARLNAEGLAELRGEAKDTGDEVDELADTIRNFGKANIDVDEATRDFEQALDDLTQSVIDNGTEWRITEEAGRKNRQAMQDIATATKDVVAANIARGASEEEATALMQAGHDELIKQLETFGIVGAEAEAYAADLGLIPSDIGTAADFLKDPDAPDYDKEVRNIPLTWDTQSLFHKDPAAVEYDGFLRKIPVDAKTQAIFYKDQGMEDYKQSVLKIPESVTTRAIFYKDTYETIFKKTVPGTAVGGMFGSAQVRLIGEAGPEAVVPLRRPLSQVDPAVRELSAFAQGLGSFRQGGGGGGNTGPQKSITVADGAIRVEAAKQPYNTASAVLDRLVQRL